VFFRGIDGIRGTCRNCNNRQEFDSRWYFLHSEFARKRGLSRWNIPDVVKVARSRKREVVTRQIADETLLVPVAGGVGDLDAIYTLNEVAAYIWAFIDVPREIDEIVRAVSRTFDVASEQADRDVAEFLTALESSGLVERGAAGSIPEPAL